MTLGVSTGASSGEVSPTGVLLGGVFGVEPLTGVFTGVFVGTDVPATGVSVAGGGAGVSVAGGGTGVSVGGTDVGVFVTAKAETGAEGFPIKLNANKGNTTAQRITNL